MFNGFTLNKRTIYTYLKNICTFNQYKPKNLQLVRFYSRYNTDVLKRNATIR